MQVNARNKIAAMQREASEKQIAIINKHNVEKLQLERKIKTLKKFESYYRGYLKTFLNDQKRRLDSELMDGNEPLQLTDTSSSDVNRDDFLSLNSNTNKNKRFTSQNDVGDSNLANSYSSGNIVGGHHEDKREETEENVEMFYQKEDLGSLPKLKRVPIFSDNNNPQ
jgi:hypothetical protein